MQESERLELFSVLLFASFFAMALLLLAVDAFIGDRAAEPVIETIEVVEEEPAIHRQAPQFVSFAIDS